MNRQYRNAALYIPFAIFSEPLFWGPILTKTVVELGKLSLSEMYFQEAVCVVLMFLIDIPTGAIADIIGRKRTLIIGQSFLLVSYILFALMSEPLHTWLANICWAIGAAFRSGADSSLIYESLPLENRDAVYHKLESKVQGWKLALMAIGALASGWMAHIDLRLPLLVSVPFVGISFITTFFLVEERSHHTLREVKYSFREHLHKMYEGLMYTVHIKKILWLMCFSALLSAAGKLWFFTYNPYFEKVGLDVQEFGYIFFMLNIVGWAASHFNQKILEKLGERTMLITLLLSTAIPIMIMGIFPLKIMALGVFFQNITRGGLPPLFLAMSQKYITNNAIRATTLSVKSSVGALAGAGSQIIFGYALTQAGFLSTLTGLGVVTLILGLLCMTWYGKLFKK